LGFDAFRIVLRIAAIRATTWVLVGDPIVASSDAAAGTGPKSCCRTDKKAKIRPYRDAASRHHAL